MSTSWSFPSTPWRVFARASPRFRASNNARARCARAGGESPPPRDADADAHARRRAPSRSWSTTRDSAYARLARRRRSPDDVDETDADARAVDAATLRRATTRDARRREREGGQTRDSDEYWGVDDDLSGWARMMGEEPATKTVKSTPPARAAASAYKRGGERPWEAAARERNARRERAMASSSKSNETPNDVSPFVRAGLPTRCAEAARRAGLKRTTEIQRLAVPALMSGKNCALLAETGSGKTFAYLLPTLAQMTAPGRKGTKRSGRCCPACVVLAPNVELGKQVTNAAELAAYWCSSDDVPTPRVFALLGKEKKLVKPTSKGKKGAASKEEKRRMKKRGERGGETSASAKAGKAAKLSGDEEAIPEFVNADVLVCTPARLLRLIKDEWVLLGRLAHVVVDEADEMLTSGFASDIGEILKLTHGESGVNRFGGTVQHIFAAATMREAKPLLDAFPGEVEWISTSQFGRVHPQLRVRVDDVRGEDAKFDALHAAIVRHDQYKSLIFVNSPEEADDIVAKLDARDVVALAFHGRAKERGVVLDDFIGGDLRVCVCTDLAARGIDFPRLHHVAQYGAAPSMEMYLHRCGRTARTGQEGPFHVTCVVDSSAETMEDDVALAMGVKRRYERRSSGDDKSESDDAMDVSE